MSISLIRGCSRTRLAEADKQFFERPEIDRCPSAHARNAPIMRVRSIIRRARVRFSGGSRARDLEDFDQLTARAEKQHRTKLRVDAAAENQFVAVARDHRLTTTPKISGLRALANVV